MSNYKHVLNVWSKNYVFIDVWVKKYKKNCTNGQKWAKWYEYVIFWFKKNYISEAAYGSKY